MNCPHYISSGTMARCALADDPMQMIVNPKDMPCKRCLELSGGDYPTDPIHEIHFDMFGQKAQRELKIEEEQTNQRAQDPCSYRSEQPTDKQGCPTCPGKWLFECKHPQKGGTVTLKDCGRCPLYE